MKLWVLCDELLYCVYSHPLSFYHFGLFLESVCDPKIKGFNVFVLGNQIIWLEKGGECLLSSH